MRQGAAAFGHGSHQTTRIGADMSRDDTRRPSEESSEAQLELAVRQGRALHEALEAMDEESDSGVLVRREGEYEIAVAVEEAEGMWSWSDGKLEWRNPTDENCHVEVCVRDGADGRFVPYLGVTATLIDDEGRELGPHEQPFIWHPWLYHYGRNWTVPEGGAYRVRVRIEPPGFMRHDHENGSCYTEPVEVEFEAIEIEPAQKTV
jgi:Fe2+ transport protein